MKYHIYRNIEHVHNRECSNFGGLDRVHGIGLMQLPGLVLSCDRINGNGPAVLWHDRLLHELCMHLYTV